jgi:hypothetical protein
MKKILSFSIIISLLVFSIVSCSKDDTTPVETDLTDNGTTVRTNKYEVKSGKIEYNEHFDMGGMFFTDTKIIIYFDNYGIIESREEYENDVLKKRKYTNDNYRYDVTVSSKSVSKYLNPSYKTGIEDKFEILSTYTTDSHWKILADTAILGKTCKMYSFRDVTVYNGKESVTSTKNAGYKGIYFYKLITALEIPITTTIQSYEEGVTMPVSAFSYPSDYTVTLVK